VCTTAELLQIPLTLDTTRTVTIPYGMEIFDEKITVSPSDDPDFQKYLDKIKGYTIESLSLSTTSSKALLPTSSIFFFVEFPEYGFVTTKRETLFDGKEIVLDIPGDMLVKMAESIQKNGSITMNVSGYTVNFSGGNIDFKVKINLKIKV
ncbi:MAG: hypothetical protein ACK46B_00965, partial [Bacteroidota bacterium]